ncbi:MAG TPA: F0F1 ATP synthase subunit B' [Sneathiellales bacterium]|nr:F0F1 ATP synthase subunit B' [Sneathiellales bacterium]
MPQINPEFFGTQLVWLTITFVALYFVLSKLVLPRIAEVLEARQDRIADDLDEADRLRKDSERVLAEYEASLAEAREKAHAFSLETHAKMAADAERRKAELETRLAENAQKANVRIQEAKSTALANVREISAQTAQFAIERLIGISVAEDTLHAAVDAELAARQV